MWLAELRQQSLLWHGEMDSLRAEFGGDYWSTDAFVVVMCNFEHLTACLQCRYACSASLKQVIFELVLLESTILLSRNNSIINPPSQTIFYEFSDHRYSYRRDYCGISPAYRWWSWGILLSSSNHAFALIAPDYSYQKLVLSLQNMTHA